MLRWARTSFSAEVSIIKHKDKTGQDRIGIVFRDVAGRKRVDEETKRLNEELEKRVEEQAAQQEAAVAELKNKERYRMLTEETSDGIWEWDVCTGDLYWNDRLFEIFGLSRSGFVPTFEGFVELVHPGDRWQIMCTIAACPEWDTSKHDVPFAAELQLLHYTDVTELALEAGYLKSRGRTPHNTMRARLSIDVRDNPQSPFLQTASGVYGLKRRGS